MKTRTIDQSTIQGQTSTPTYCQLRKDPRIQAVEGWSKMTKVELLAVLAQVEGA